MGQAARLTATSTTDRSDVVGLVPQGTAPPESIPPDVFEAALHTVLSGRRLEMQQLAIDLDVSRSTLYRRVADRDELLGEVVWFLVRQALVPTLDSVRDLCGAERIVEGVLRFLALVRHPRPEFERLLQEEPAMSLRVLASKAGPVQGHLIEITRRVICEERERGALTGSADPQLIATAIIRLSESFLYGHLIAGEDLDLSQLARMIRRLLGEEDA